MSEHATISAVSRTLQAIEFLAVSPQGATVSAVAEHVGIKLSIASRILATLARDGYARRDAHGHYHLTYRLVAAASRFVEAVGFVDVCIPFLQEVADKTGELVQLALREGDSLWFVAKAEGKHRIRMLSALGREAPLHASSVGKAWLATLPENEALRLAAARGFTRFTAQTITGVSRLRTELRKVRAQGYSVVEQEYIEEGIAVGAAVRIDRLGDAVVGAVSIAAPNFRVTRETIQEFGREAVQLAQRVATMWPIGAGAVDLSWGEARQPAE